MICHLQLISFNGFKWPCIINRGSIMESGLLTLFLWGDSDPFLPKVKR